MSSAGCGWVLPAVQQCLLAVGACVLTTLMAILLAAGAPTAVRLASARAVRASQCRHDDMTAVALALRPPRWKVFQVMSGCASAAQVAEERSLG